VEFDHVLLVSDGSQATVGNPLIPNAQVSGTVVEASKAKKVIIFKFKRKKQYKVTRGHRQPYTAVQIKDIKLS
jgi:large subunit ribosomal protein L21